MLAYLTYFVMTLTTCVLSVLLMGCSCHELCLSELRPSKRYSMTMFNMTKNNILQNNFTQAVVGYVIAYSKCV